VSNNYNSKKTVMKFSVQVETESRTYDRVGFSESPSPRHLRWKIDVDIHQNIIKDNKENIEVGVPRKKIGVVETVPRNTVGVVETVPRNTVGEVETVPRNTVGVVETVPRKMNNVVETVPRKESKQFGMEPRIIMEDDNVKKRGVSEENVGRVRKMSKLEREEELVRQAMRKSSRKVSREGEWLVLREKTGLLTTQNGTQQIRETRVRISEGDLVKLCEEGL